MTWLISVEWNILHSIIAVQTDSMREIRSYKERGLWYCTLQHLEIFLQTGFFPTAEDSVSRRRCGGAGSETQKGSADTWEGMLTVSSRACAEWLSKLIWLSTCFQIRGNKIGSILGSAERFSSEDKKNNGTIQDQRPIKGTMTPVCGRLKSFCQCVCHSSFNVNKIQSLTHATLFSRLPETNKPFCVKLTKEKCVCLICGTTFTFLIPLVSWNSLKWKSLAFVTPFLFLTGLLTSTYHTSKKKAVKKKKKSHSSHEWHCLRKPAFLHFQHYWLQLGTIPVVRGL